MEHIPSKTDIAAFRAWLNKVPYLNQDVDDYFIASFLQAAKGRMEKAKTTFDSFHNVRIKYPDLFSNLDPLDPLLERNVNAGYIVLSPHLAKDGSIVITGAITDPDVSKFSVSILYRYLHMVVLSILLNPDNVRFGEKWSGKVRLVWDLEEFKLGHVALYTPRIIKGAMEYLSSSIPMRMTGMHLVNVKPAAERLFNIMKTFLKKKLADRIFIHANYKEIQEYVPEYALPSDLGGTLGDGTEFGDKLLQRLRDNKEIIYDWDKKMCELGKIRPNMEEDIIVGSFKKLEVD